MNKLKEKRLFLLDMDGTIYLDNDLFDGTLDFLEYVRKLNGRYLFLTNNSSKSVDKYIEKLLGMGIKSQAEDFLTSVDATVSYLSKNCLSDKIYAFGTASFKKQLSNAGFDITDTLTDNIDTLVMGFDTELSFQKLEDACILLGRGVKYIATNPDYVCPTYYGYVPDCGSVADMLYNATKRRPHIIGKPQPDMVFSALAKTGYKASDAILLGDRIYTDIACGVNAGISTALLFSGEATKKDLAESEVKPEYTFENIREFLCALRH